MSVSKYALNIVPVPPLNSTPMYLPLCEVCLHISKEDEEKVRFKYKEQKDTKSLQTMMKGD